MKVEAPAPIGDVQRKGTARSRRGRGAAAVDRVHDVFVNAPLEADVGPVAEDLAVVDDLEFEGISEETP